jgi:hypothetical protein
LMILMWGWSCQSPKLWHFFAGNSTSCEAVASQYHCRKPSWSWGWDLENTPTSAIQLIGKLKLWIHSDNQTWQLKPQDRKWRFEWKVHLYMANVRYVNRRVYQCNVSYSNSHEHRIFWVLHLPGPRAQSCELGSCVASTASALADLSAGPKRWSWKQGLPLCPMGNSPIPLL